MSLRRMLLLGAVPVLLPVLAARALGQELPNVESRIDAMMGKLSSDDEVKLLSGVKGFYTAAAPSIGLPRFRMSDGPVGTRDTIPSTAYPAGALLAAAWDPDLAQREGVALGQDDRSRGIHVLLGPGVNIYRVPQCGRNEEYFGEDPFLAGRMAVGYIRGVQSQGVAACVKHFACYNQETHRELYSANVSERALQEIYFPAFEAAIKQGGSRTIMSSYNRVNGFYASANKYLLTTVLRDQWHFDGLVMSDWNGTHEVVGMLKAGLDLEMPGGKWLTPKNLAAPIQDGELTKPELDQAVRPLLRVALQLGWLDRPQQDSSFPMDNPQSDAVAYDVASEGITLLKNDSNLLPLQRNQIHRIAVLGDGVDRYVSGLGSSKVKPARPVSLLDGLKAAASTVQFDQVPFNAIDVSTLAKTSKYDGGSLTATFYGGRELGGNPRGTRQDTVVDFDLKRPPGEGIAKANYSIRWTGKITAASTGPTLFAIRSDDGSRVKLDGQMIIDSWYPHAPQVDSAQVDLTAGRTYDLTIEYFKEGGDAVAQFGYTTDLPKLPDADRERIASADSAIVLVHQHDEEGMDHPYNLPMDQERLISAVSAVNPHTIVVLESSGNVAMKGWIDQVPALVDAWYPGQAGGRAIAAILFGDVNPSGHLPDTFEKEWSDSPAFGNYPDQDLKTDYAEGIYVGYRSYDKRGVEPRFPFGYGLSYTTFDMKNPHVTPAGSGDGQTFAVAVDVTNTGKVAGAAVAQLYVRPPVGPVDRPPQELKGFARVQLEPGETKSVMMTLDRRSFAYWDEKIHDWVVAPGTYELGVGRSSRDECCKATVQWK